MYYDQTSSLTVVWSGYIEDLPLLIKGRSDHACAGFYNYAGKFVLLVAGGESYGEGDMFSSSTSTESLEVGKTEWIENSPLPHKLLGVRAATVDNKIFLMGK